MSTNITNISRVVPPPHGYVNEIAKILGCHRVTVSNALKKNAKGILAEQARQLYKVKYGMANKELVFQNKEKEKRAAELIIANEAILQSEKNFHRSISESPLGIRIIAVDGETIYANKAFLDIFEFNNLEEFTSIPAINRYTPESYAQHQERKEKRKNGHDVFDYEISIVCKNTEIRYVKVSRREIMWNGTKHYQVINLDITEQKKLTIDLIAAKKQAEESESSLRNAQKIAKMSSWEWDKVTQKINWSGSYLTISGFKSTKVEPSFELFRSRIHPDDVHFFDEMYAKVLKDKTPLGFEIRLMHPDGTIKWIQNNLSPVIEDDKLVKLKGVIIDINDRKQAELALKESEIRLLQLNIDKDRFLSILGHDLRSPFNALLGLSEILKENIQEFHIDEIKGMAGDINKTAQSTFNLLEDILTWASTKAGQPDHI